jgi:hypothetical protein
MKSKVKLKEIAIILKSGFVGALALSGICIVLFLFGFAYRNEFISHLYQETFARCSLQGLFIATGGIGFILGIIVRRRLTLKKEAVLVAVFSIPIILGAWVLDAIGSRVSTPHAVKLADCTNQVMNIHVRTPRGHAYQLELHVPEIQFVPSSGKSVSSYKFSGHLRVSTAGAQLADLPIGSDIACLTESGFVLTGVGLQNTNAPPLNQFLQSGKDYDFEIGLIPPPPTNASIWLYWRESQIDK